jgi:hypothetical protein
MKHSRMQATQWKSRFFLRFLLPLRFPTLPPLHPFYSPPQTPHPPPPIQNLLETISELALKSLVHKNYQCTCFFIWGCMYGFGWGEIHFSGRLKGWALKSRLFWAQMALTALVAVSEPTPSKSPRYGFYPIQIHTSHPI